MHVVFSTVPDAAGVACGEQRVCREADLLGQLAPRRYFRRLTAPDTATREVPLDPIRRAHKQYRPTDVDRHKRPLMPLAPQSPPDAGKRETKAECCPPGSVASCPPGSVAKRRTSG